MSGIRPGALVTLAIARPGLDIKEEEKMKTCRKCARPSMRVAWRMFTGDLRFWLWYYRERCYWNWPSAFLWTVSSALGRAIVRLRLDWRAWTWQRQNCL